VQLSNSSICTNTINDANSVMGWCCPAKENDDWNSDSDCVTISTDNRELYAQKITSSVAAGPAEDIEIIDSETT